MSDFVSLLLYVVIACSIIVTLRARPLSLGIVIIAGWAVLAVLQVYWDETDTVGDVFYFVLWCGIHLVVSTLIWMVLAVLRDLWRAFCRR